MRLMKERREMTVKELCAAFYCSPATIRRDLAELEDRGLLRRSFGGAVLNESFFDQQPLSVRGVRNIAEKQRICAKAAGLIHAGETIFLDASSTTYFLAPYLKDIPELTVITSNPHLNIVLSQMKVNNYCTGGKMLTSSVALVGSEAEHFVEGIRADAFFFSARSMDEEFIYDSSKEERDLKITMHKCASRSYFLCDRSKMGEKHPYIITSIDSVDGVISED